MNPPTVFKFLDRMYLASMGLNFMEYNRFREESLQEYIAIIPDCTNMAEIIRQEYFRKAGNLTAEEQGLIRRFTTEERDKATTKINELLHKAARNYYDGFDINYAWNLKDAGKQISRAYQAIQVESTICPEANMDYDAFLRQNDRLRDRLHVLWEFPLSYGAVTPLYSELREAIQEEDYERATQLRDSIESIVSANQEEFMEH